MTEFAPRLDIQKKALCHNYALLCAKARQTHARKRLWCVVKANAYGHGMTEVARTLTQAGADAFAVATLAEGIALRAAVPDAAILVLGITSPKEAYALAEHRLSQAVHTLSYAVLLARHTPAPLSVHVKVDVGMHRLGFDSAAPEETVADILAVRALPRLQIDGIYAHLPEADDPASQKTPNQISLFSDIVRVLQTKGLSAHTHLCNSAGTLRFGSAGFDGVRCGMALYGISPSEKVCCAALSAAMSLTCPIVQIKTVRKGDCVGYGGAFCAKETTRIATLPVGYRDGLLRACEGGQVRLYGKRVKIVGHVCMDMTMVDIGAIPAQVGDRVRFFGKGQEELFALASQAGTTPYELLSLLSPAICRIYRR